jgi:hypothetical protein
MRLARILGDTLHVRLEAISACYFPVVALCLPAATSIAGSRKAFPLPLILLNVRVFLVHSGIDF